MVIRCLGERNPRPKPSPPGQGEGNPSVGSRLFRDLLMLLFRQDIQSWLKEQADKLIASFLNFIYFFHKRHTERGRNTGRGRSRLHARSTMWVGVDPGSPGSCFESKADAQPLSHSGVPVLIFYSSYRKHMVNVSIWLRCPLYLENI